ncbi:glutamate synthase [Tundrisphaera sp. TA3]|uniref:glutamate synthase n=1 Tax=Tundrisphaera sp. TA3 TaxID=3435775 RepID=UPI003EB8CA0A
MPRHLDRPGGDRTPPAVPVLLIPEIRDYQRINAELVGLLDAGHRRVRLEGVEGQRLLIAGLVGSWEAVVELDGRPGPECAADLDAPGLVVRCSGRAADGAGRGLKAGRVLFRDGAGDSAGYGQGGGLLVILGPIGHRAGLDQAGGTFAALGPVGRLAGERQSGGRLFLVGGRVGPHAGRGQRGGRRIELPLDAGAGPEDRAAWDEVLDLAPEWPGPAASDG